MGEGRKRVAGEGGGGVVGLSSIRGWLGGNGGLFVLVCACGIVRMYVWHTSLGMV